MYLIQERWAILGKLQKSVFSGPAPKRGWGNKLEGEGGKALVAGPLKKTFFAASLTIIWRYDDMIYLDSSLSVKYFLQLRLAQHVQAPEQGKLINRWNWQKKYKDVQIVRKQR